LIKLPSTFISYCGLAVLSGAVYAMAFPPFGWRWLIFVSIAGLLLALRNQHGARARAIGFLFGLTAYAMSLSWLHNIFGNFAIALWCVLAAFTALFAEMQSRATRCGLGGWKFAIFTAANWCGWEFIRAELFHLKLPWMTAGLAIGPNTLLPWIGVYGVSLFVVAAAAFISQRMVKSAIISVAILIIALATSSRCPEPRIEDPLSVRVAGIQLENVSIDDYIAKTKDVDPAIQYIVWPECAVPYHVRENQRDWGALQKICRDRDITLTFGTQRHDEKPDAWRNIALTIDPTGVRGEHNKVHTVHFFNDGISGKTALPVQTKYGKVGTPICFDNDYEGVVRRMTAAGAEMFVAPTMDVASWSARQHDQHAELFRIRACENQRWIFSCASSGVSQLIDANGHLHHRLAALQEGTISGIIKRKSKLTMYTRVGWLTPWCILTISALCWIYLLFYTPKKKATLPV
jgi:apolipoprotein N-acyltransferase